MGCAATFQNAWLRGYDKTLDVTSWDRGRQHRQTDTKGKSRSSARQALGLVLVSALCPPSARPPFALLCFGWLWPSHNSLGSGRERQVKQNEA